ncbi:MAG: rhomboid family intramembrane serine protease [Thermodesulfovibrionia bacterium]|nr:rhomboid family intramembrane serine protease [Thermodesulfovibrionia bacterium]
MIPYKDDNPTSTFPFVTIMLIVANIYIFFYTITHMSNPEEYKNIVYSYGAIPSYLLSFDKLQPIHPSLTVFTSMFMHGGFLHLGSNMLYLWIFGNNIEDTLGHFWFLIFYLMCGIAAAYAHAFTAPSSLMPMIGASGAVSGVLGAYILMFPRAKVYTLIFLGFFIQVIRLPAYFVIGFWIVIQLLNGLVSKGVAGEGGVAWFAHIGGFLAGLALIMLLPKVNRSKRYSL